MSHGREPFGFIIVLVRQMQIGTLKGVTAPPAPHYLKKDRYNL
jgi:hypothetical protein